MCWPLKNILHVDRSRALTLALYCAFLCTLFSWSTFRFLPGTERRRKQECVIMSTYYTVYIFYTHSIYIYTYSFKCLYIIPWKPLGKLRKPQTKNQTTFTSRNKAKQQQQQSTNNKQEKKQKKTRKKHVETYTGGSQWILSEYPNWTVTQRSKLKKCQVLCRWLFCWIRSMPWVAGVPGRCGWDWPQTAPSKILCIEWPSLDVIQSRSCAGLGVWSKNTTRGVENRVGPVPLNV